MSFILGVVALVWIYTLSQRVQSLEKRIGGVTPTSPTAQPGGEKAVTPVSIAQDFVPSGTVVPVMNTVRVLEQTPYVPDQPDVVSRFIDWVRVDFVMKLGAFFLLCALGWFVSYAFMNNLIGEAGRIALGLIVGTGFLILGYWRMKTQVHQGGIFAVLGSTTVLLTVYAARELYDFFTPTSALGLMFLSTAFVALIAVRFNSEKLALASLILASVAPVFTNSPHPDVVGQFTYLLVITLGSLWVVYLRGWSSLILTALVVVFLHGTPYLWYIRGGDQDIVLLFAFVFTAVFFVANILGLTSVENEKNRVAHLVIAVGTGLYLILWILAAAEPEWQSLLFVAWMLVFGVGSFIVYQRAKNPFAFYIYGGTSIALLGAATACELKGPELGIAYTLEVGVLVYIALKVFKRLGTGSILAWLFLIPVLFSAESIMSSDWSLGVFHDSFAMLNILMLTLAVVGAEFCVTSKRINATETHAGMILLTLASMYAVALVWLVLHAGSMFTYETATLFALVIYAVTGIILFTQGKQMKNEALRYGGGVLIGLVTLRLLFVEVWNMELPGRIITFGVLGLLFLSTAFLRKSTKEPVIIDAQK